MLRVVDDGRKITHQQTETEAAFSNERNSTSERTEQY